MPGQFRTPRHIIDFIVSIVDPKKNETVLDPACGTAGFLISAYKHILAANSKEGKGDLLSGDERGRLMDNFCGYDISPDMVRLSRANMYLHGFPQPRIHEYDTLTSEDRWDERYDVIMANPPFMTPKGGIRPHNLFSIRASRSEVLFVDYIAEHLNVNGRAGVIVPEGIIFQSQNAYKNLRKMLVENYLWCVVSLPSGLFNPYSGVKTSILLMDKALAKRTDEILFVKIENDGFDLGAQRRPIAKNNLPDALKALEAWKLSQNKLVCPLAHSVSRKHILESPDFNLSGDRYKGGDTHVTRNWPHVTLDEVVEINRCTVDPASKFGESLFTYLDISSVENGTGNVSYNTRLRGVDAPSRARRVVQSNDVLLSTVRPNLKAFACLVNPPLDAIASTGFAVLTPKADKIDGRFLWFLPFEGRMINQMTALMGKGAYPSINQTDVERLLIPLPPFDIQTQIVAELDGYRKIIEGANQIIANYKPVLCVDPAWETVPLDQVCSIKRGRFSHRPRNSPQFYGGSYPFMQTGDVVKSHGGPVLHTQTLNELGLSVSKLFEPPAVLITIAANIGDTGLLTYPACFPDSVVALTPNEQVKAEFLELAMRGQKQELNRLAPQAAQKNINVEILRRVEIPLPSLDIQREIVNELEIEKKLVDANRELIARMGKKIQDKLAEIWGEKTVGEESAAAMTNGE